MIKYRINGREVSRQDFLRKKHRTGGVPMVARAWERELHCEALAVNPEDVPARKAVDERLKLKVAGYDENGCPVFTNRRDYAEYVRSEGCHFRDTRYPKKKRLGKVIVY